MKNKITLIIFLLLMVASLFLAGRVSVNYNLEEYLPKDSMITEGINIYTEEFGDSSQVTFSFDETNISNALSLKEEILLIEEVDRVLFIDDYFNEMTYGLIRENLPTVQQTMLDSALNNLLLSGLSYPEAFLSLLPYMPVEAKIQFENQLVKFVSDEEMLMHVILNTKSTDLDTELAIDEIKALLDEDGHEYYFTGNAVSSIFTKNTIESEVLIITLICIPLVLIVLLFMSKSFFDIVIFGIIVGISIIINLGTNVLLPSISFITQSMAIALQLAISLDYVNFMLSAYHQARADGESVDESLKSAKKKTRKPIIASALTTGASFLALIFMRFTIGFDIGIVFAKAIIISLVTTVVLLPILIKYFH
ncbi:MAG: MMPL family transporter, partial [Tenericutes bacterium]|nr:MMPL family transporter [Mycoplasmatota bacterium]